MLIILPPSESKAHGGDGPPLDWEQLNFPSLTATRRAIAADLVALSEDTDTSLAVLGISNKLRDEVVSNAELESSPTMPAILRYTGVLYDALNAATLPEEALNRIAIGSALFGIIAANDQIPHYRLSGGTKLPTSTRAAASHGGNNDKAPTMKARWGKTITQALNEVNELIVDLRSGTYQQLGPLPTAITVRVESEQPDGSRKVVSHFNKHYKGQLARALATCEQPDTSITSIEDIATIATAAGFSIELPKPGAQKPRELTLVTHSG